MPKLSIAKGIKIGLAILITAQFILKAADPFEVNQKLAKGINIIGYDPLWRNKEKARFKQEYFKLIKQAGFNHVRINLHPFRDNPGFAEGSINLREEYLQTLDWAVTNALAAELMVVIDFHEFTLMGKAPEKYKPAFLKCWEILAIRLQKCPNDVLFELLNEPNSALTPQLWNQYITEALAIVRKSNPNRTVIIGPGQWNNINALEQLNIPAQETNVIVTIHYYSPFDFTHQGAAFANRADKVGIRWGTKEDRAAIIADFDKAQRWAAQNKRPIYLGEFGVYDKAPEPDRSRWLSFVVQQAQRRSWSWAYWQFDGDFIAFDIKSEQWITTVLKALMHPEAVSWED